MHGAAEQLVQQHFLLSHRLESEVSQKSGGSLRGRSTAGLGSQVVFQCRQVDAQPAQLVNDAR
jgi:hypothetical protein